MTDGSMRRPSLSGLTPTPPRGGSALGSGASEKGLLTRTSGGKSPSASSTSSERQPPPPPPPESQRLERKLSDFLSAAASEQVAQVPKVEVASPRSDEHASSWPAACGGGAGGDEVRGRGASRGRMGWLAVRGWRVGLSGCRSLHSHYVCAADRAHTPAVLPPARRSAKSAGAVAKLLCILTRRP